MPAPVSLLSLSERDQQQLQEWASAHGTPQQVAVRCRIVLAAAAGQSDNSIAQQYHLNRKTVMLWRTRFAQQGFPCFRKFAHDRVRKRSYRPSKAHTNIHTSMQSKTRALPR